MYATIQVAHLHVVFDGYAFIHMTICYDRSRIAVDDGTYYIIAHKYATYGTIGIT